MGGGALGRAVVGGLLGVERLVGDLLLEVQAVAQRQQLRLGHLLDLVGGVARLDLGPERPSLHGLGENDGGLSHLLRRQLVGRVELAVVVAAARQGLELLVGEVLDEAAQAGVGAEEVLPDVGARLGGVLLELAVGRGVHLVEQDAVDVAGQELVPLRSPDDLDHVPARAAEDGLGFLDDLAVAAHRAVEALQVAVDDEDQVVEVLATGHAQGADGLDLVELAVAEEGPDAVGAGVDDLALEEIARRVGLVDGAQGAEAHRDGGVLPEVGEEAGVGVAREPLARDLLAEVVELVLGEAALDEGAGVDAGGAVALEVDEVPEAAVGLPPEEVVEAHLVERGRAGVGGEMAADAFAAIVGPAHHGRGVPADVGADAALDVFVAGEPRLLVAGDGVHVRGRDRGGEVDLLGPGALEELHEQEAGPGASLGVDDGVERVDPFRGLLGVDVGKLMRHSVEEHCSMLRAPLSRKADTHEP